MIFKKTDTKKIADYCGKSKAEYVKVEHYKPNRTLEQNALFHKWCEIISDETGHTPAEIKFLIKYLFLGEVDIEVLGNYYRMVKPTRNLNVEKFNKFLQETEKWAFHFLGLNLPNRETLLYDTRN